MARGPGTQHTQRRTEIADAVLAVVADRGLGAVSLSTVSGRAGVSPGRVQHYFPARQDLLEAAFDRANALASARIPDVHASPPRDVLTAVLTGLIPHDPATRTHLRVRQAFTALALTDDSIAERMRADYARLHRDLAALLPRPATVAAAVRLVALTEGLAYYVLIGVTTADDARDAVLAALEACWT